MVLHMIAFLRIHVCCILKLMHLLTFIRIFIVAFGTRCIHVHLNAYKFGCIFIACCILVHSSHKMHSRAFFVCCILYMPHLNAFQYILSLVHFECAAFYLLCIYVHIVYFSDDSTRSSSLAARPWTRSRPCTSSRRRRTLMCATRTAQSRRNPSPRWAARPSTPRSFPSWAGCSCSCIHENACEGTHIHTNAYECI
jgi:hypothetical protein